MSEEPLTPAIAELRGLIRSKGRSPSRPMAGSRAALRGRGIDRTDGPDGVAIAWSDNRKRALRLSAGGPARVLRIGFEQGDGGIVLHQPWRRQR